MVGVGAVREPPLRGGWVDHGNHFRMMAVMVQKSLSKRVVVCCFGLFEVRIFGDMNAEWRAFVYVSVVLQPCFR